MAGQVALHRLRSLDRQLQAVNCATLHLAAATQMSHCHITVVNCNPFAPSLEGECEQSHVGCELQTVLHSHDHHLDGVAPCSSCVDDVLHTGNTLVCYAKKVAGCVSLQQGQPCCHGVTLLLHNQPTMSVPTHWRSQGHCTPHPAQKLK